MGVVDFLHAMPFPNVRYVRCGANVNKYIGMNVY